MGTAIKLLRADEVVCNYSPSQQSLGKFRFWHVEPLLNQAADLLDRCLVDRAIHDGLRAQWHDLSERMDLEERQLQITRDRVQAGGLTIDKDILEYHQTNALGIHKKYETLQWNYQQNFDGNHQGAADPSPKTRHLDDAHVVEAAIARSWAALDYEEKQRQLTWETKDLVFKERGIALSEASFIARKKLMEEGQPFDLPGQDKPVLERLKRDYEDAHDRLMIAAEGLQLIFGFPKTFPNNPQWCGVGASLDSDNLYGPIDSAILWVREAIRWLTAFSQLDQETTHTFSVKQLVTERVWKDAIKAAGASVTIPVAIPQAMFDRWTYVRFRGLAGFVIGPEIEEGPWWMEVKLPESAITRQIVDEGEVPESQRQPKRVVDRKLKQANLPSAYLGRVEGRDSPRAPELAGAISLMNASPIGEIRKDGRIENWTVTLGQPLGGRATWKALDDIELELHVSGRPI
jgi:hypothetical protein